MELTNEQISFYKDNGFLLVDDVFNSTEIQVLLNEMDEVIKEDSPRRILEKNGSVRSFFAPHFSSEIFNKTNCLDRLVTPSTQLIGSPVYVHQSKINVKAAMLGDWWEWHQDYPYWKNDDGMPRPDVLTAMIFLSETNEFNGPLLLIPGSHRNGEFDDRANEIEADPNDAEWYAKYLKSASFMTSLTSNLKYKLERKKRSRNGLKKRGFIQLKERRGLCCFSTAMFSMLPRIIFRPGIALPTWSRITAFIISSQIFQNRALNFWL